MDFEELMFCAVAVVVVVLLLTYHLPVYPGLVLNLWASYLGHLKFKSTSHHTWLVLLFTVCIYLSVCDDGSVEFREQLGRVNYLLAPCGTDSGHKAQWQGPYGTEPSCWPHVLLLMLHLLVPLFISAVLL